MDTSKLTPKQKAFCEEYLIDLNATQAAIRAGYSSKTANTVAAQNLAKLSIQEYISFLKGKREERTEIKADDVLKNLVLAQEIALGIKPHHVIVKDSVGNGVTETISQELKKTDLTNYVKINEIFMKHLGMFEKDNEQTKTDITIEIE